MTPTSLEELLALFAAWLSFFFRLYLSYVDWNEVRRKKNNEHPLHSRSPTSFFKEIIVQMEGDECWVSEYLRMNRENVTSTVPRQVRNRDLLRYYLSLSVEQVSLSMFVPHDSSRFFSFPKQNIFSFLLAYKSPISHFARDSTHWISVTSFSSLFSSSFCSD